MDKVLKIQLVFENLEVIELYSDMFKCLSIYGLKINKNINCYQYRAGETQDMKVCEYFHIQINEKGMRQLGYMEKDKPLKDRVRDCDITCITLIDENYNEENIYVPWNEEDEFTNKYQKNAYNEDNIKITIEERNDKYA